MITTLQTYFDLSRVTFSLIQSSPVNHCHALIVPLIYLVVGAFILWFWAGPAQNHSLELTYPLSVIFH